MKKIALRGSKPLLLSALGLGFVSAFAAALVIAPGSLAATANEPGYTVEPVGTPVEPGYTVENYIHPNADQIAATTNILLKEGDGQLMYAECDGNVYGDLIVVNSHLRPNEEICFKLTGPSGWLKMEIPGSYGVASADKPLTVTSVTPGSTTETTNLPANGFANLATSAGEKVVLVELRVKN